MGKACKSAFFSSDYLVMVIIAAYETDALRGSPIVADTVAGVGLCVVVTGGGAAVDAAGGEQQRP